MRKGRMVLILIAFTLPLIAHTQDTLQARIVLIGDAGGLKNGSHPVISSVRSRTVFDNKTTVLYLGDNLYLTGLPDEQATIYDIRRQILDTQIAIAGKSAANVYFIPGNHDWERGGPGGYSAVLREQAYINAAGNNKIKFYPEDGCSGPVELKITDDVTMVLFDSQWWIHPFTSRVLNLTAPTKQKPSFLVSLKTYLPETQKNLLFLHATIPLEVMARTEEIMA